MHIIHLPLDCIDADALPRDRGEPGAEAMQTLIASIARDGLRMPVEVFELAEPREGFTHGLISGWRRLAAVRSLRDSRSRFDPGNAPATIAAVLRTPDSIPAALAAMVTENEVREAITPWDKGRALCNAVAHGYFDTLDAAVKGMHPDLPRQDQARLRALAGVVTDLPDAFHDPHLLTQRQLLRLATAIRAGFSGLIAVALEQSAAQSAAAQWAVIDPILREAEEEARNPSPPDPRPGHPRRIVHPRKGLVIRRERTAEGWNLRFTGPEAKGGLIEDIMGYVEREFGR